MKSSQRILTAFFYLITLLTAFPALSQQKEIVLQPGNPPLTQTHVDRIIGLMEWALDGRFSLHQSILLKENLIGVWKRGDQEEINDVVSISELAVQLTQMKPEEKSARKQHIQQVLLDNIAKDPDDPMSKLLKEIHKQGHSKRSNSAVNNTPRAITAAKSGLRTGTDGFTGIYRMVRPKSLNINNSAYERGYIIEYITFLPGGKLYWALPPEGLLYFDTSVAKRCSPEDWGTYESKGNDIHVFRGPGRTRYLITRDGERLNNPPGLGKGSFRPIPNCDGLKLQGNYRRHESEPAISFTADGKFRDGGIFRYFGTRGRLDGSTFEDDGNGGEGNYLIDQNTLELQYSDGRIKRFVFLAFPEHLAKKPAVESFLIYEDRLERF